MASLNWNSESQCDAEFCVFNDQKLFGSTKNSIVFSFFLLLSASSSSFSSLPCFDNHILVIVRDGESKVRENALKWGAPLINWQLFSEWTTWENSIGFLSWTEWIQNFMICWEKTGKTRKILTTGCSFYEITSNRSKLVWINRKYKSTVEISII